MSGTKRKQIPSRRLAEYRELGVGPVTLLAEELHYAVKAGNLRKSWRLCERKLLIDEVGGSQFRDQSLRIETVQSSQLIAFIHSRDRTSIRFTLLTLGLKEKGNRKRKISRERELLPHKRTHGRPTKGHSSRRNSKSALLHKQHPCASDRCDHALNILDSRKNLKHPNTLCFAW